MQRPSNKNEFDVKAVPLYAKRCNKIDATSDIEKVRDFTLACNNPFPRCELGLDYVVKWAMGNIYDRTII